LTLNNLKVKGAAPCARKLTRLSVDMLVDKVYVCPYNEVEIILENRGLDIQVTEVMETEFVLMYLMKHQMLPQKKSGKGLNNMNHNDSVEIVRINKANYHLFDDMVFFRMHGRRKTTEEQNHSCDVSEIIKTLENPNLFVYAAKCDHRFCAWISLLYMPKIGRTNGKGYVYIDELWTDEEHRRKGIARNLMKKADDLSNELDALGVRLYVSNPAATALYERCGYKCDNEQVCFMEKERACVVNERTS